ncbi:uncharacterized protein LOC129264905 [Lytechinus pictus]|uniref:uncharacterized protein LOC129264905 n=1 Tax=Lytechinus pictus TaxID=7653 RepID=UPI0030B9D8D2
MEDDRGLENLGFQGSSTSLIHEPITSSLDERQKTLVRNTWKTLEKKAELHGSMMFAKLTSDHPDIGKLFSFGGKNLSYGELLVDPDVRAHGMRVIDTLGSVVEDLDDMELVVQILEDLGQRHNSYNAKKTHIKAVGEALLFTLEQAIGAGFTSDVKAAWTAVFNIVADTMSTKLSDGPLTTREQDIVRKTWGVLSLDMEQHGAAMFAKLISVHPVVAHLFPFGENLSYSQLVENQTLRAHGRKVMETIGQAVGALDDLDILVPILRDLARRHIGYSVTRQHFQPVGEALMHAIREGLGRSFSEEVKGAWLAVFQLVVDTMSDMLPEGSKEIVSPTQKRLIQESWKKLSRDPERHGSVMFAKLATSYPEVGKVFSFGGKGLTYEQLLQNQDVKAHGRRVFETVGHAVNGLDDLDLLLPTLRDLAQRHIGYNVQKRYFAPTGDAFLHAVRLGVGPSSFTSDVRNAWAELFKVVTDTMAEVVPDGPITATQKSLVQTSWKTIGQDPTRHGSVLFAKLITDNPNVGKLFPFGSMNLSYDQLLANKDLRAHGKRIMDTVGVAVSGLDDLELLIPILQDLAKRHVGYNVTKQHFKPVGESLIHALRVGLGSRFTSELEAAWSIVFSVIAETMAPLLPAGGLTTEQKNLIKGSWRIVAPEKAKCGAILFAKLVTDHPNIGRLFPFGGRNQSYQSLLMDDKLKAQGLLVMQTIGDAIRVLDNPDKLLPVLSELGKRHVSYGVTKSDFAPIGTALMNTLKETLGNSFNDNTKNAWLIFWQLIEETISEQLVGAPDDGMITSNQKEIVQRTWKTLGKDPGRHGAVMFARLVTDHPEVGRLFPFGDRGMTYHQLLWDDSVKAHGKKVMQTIGHVVDGLNNLDLLVPILQDLAKRHIEYNVNKKHLEAVGKALFYAIEKGLGNAFDSETKGAWMAVFTLVANIMSEILPDSEDEQGPLTREQRKLVQTTWKKLATNHTKHGAVMFAKLVTDNPDVGHLFPFGNKNLSYQQLLRNPQAQSHGKRVMETVGTAVAGLDDLNLLVPILKELATRHIGYKVTKQHFKCVGAALIHAIKEGLGSSFSPSIQSAWVATFDLITNTMSEILPDIAPPTSAQKEIVKRTWRKLAPNLARHGAVMFAKLVTDNPDVGHLFPFGSKNLSYQELLRDPQTLAHGKRVMETVGTAVDGLDDFDILVPILRELATRHIGYNVTKQHFSSVGAALIHAIKEGLGKTFSPDILSAWMAVFQLITNTMSEILPSVGPPTSAQKELVKRTWRTLAPSPAQHGSVMFAKLITDNPDVGHLFPFGNKNLSYQQLLRDPQAQAHGKRVMETVGTAVDGLDDLDILVPILRELATRHIGYNVAKQHFSLVGEALIHAIKEGLGSSFSPDIQGAWMAVFQLITNTMSEILPSAGPPTSAQKEIVKRTWRSLASNPAKHGAVMFAKLVTDNPDVGHLFPFGSKNLSYQQLLRDPQAQAHGKRVMETVGTAVDGLDDLDILVPILRELATRHIGYNVTKQHFSLVGAALIHAIKEGLGSSFSPDIQGAWMAVFQLITNTMSEILPSVGPPTSAQKDIVKRTWRKLASNPAQHGAVMFAKLVTDNPDVGHLFPFGNKNLSYQQLLGDPQALAHGKRVMETVGTAVDGLDDLDILVPILRELATRHIGYNVTKKHFKSVGAALIHAIKEGLGSKFSPDIQSAWVAVFQLITNTMSEILPSVGPPTSAQKEIVKRTWRSLASNPAKHGAVMFAKLVTDNPDVGHLFPFGSKNLSYQQLLRDPQALAHGKRVMETVGTAVDGLDDLGFLVPILRELATRHIGYNVTKKHFKSVGAALIHAIKEGLGSSFSPDIQSAWMAVFQLITNTMSEILQDAAPPTSEQKELVKRTWQILAPNPAKHGAVMFAKLLTRHPTVGKLFPFGKENLSYAQLLKHSKVLAHGKKVMETVGVAVDGLNDLDLLVPILRDLGGRHVGYGVNKELFEPVGEVLLETIKEALGSDFTDEVRQAWVAVFKIVSDTMSEALSKGSITTENKRLVQETWRKLATDPAKHGATMFAKLVTDYPAVGPLLPFGDEGLSYDQLLVDPRVRAHGTRVMQTVGGAVDGLNDISSVVLMLQELATRHIAYGVTKQHFSPAVSSLMYAIRQGLGRDYNSDVEKAWLAVLQIVVDTMSAELPDGTLDDAKKDLVRATWTILSRNPEQHGAVMFAKLVTDNPAIGRLFPFGKKNLSYDQLLADSQAKSHGRKVMETVGHAVSGLDDLDLLVPVLEELAQRHHQYGVTKKYFKPVGKALMHAIEEGLGQQFSSEVGEAWRAVFTVITNTMSRILPDHIILTDETKRLVKESWRILSTDPGKHGAVMFARLTTQNPIVGRLFPYGDQNLSYSQLLSNKKVRAHGTKVMETIGLAVENLDNVDDLATVLKELALRHIQYNVTKMHFEPAGQALMYAIKEGLGSSFTSKVKDAWSVVFQLISDMMSEVLPEGPISFDHIEVLKRTWKVLGQNPEQHGTVVFAKLASDHSLVSSLFPFGGKGLTYEQLLENDDVRKHGRQFMATVGSAIDNLENHEILIPLLDELAKRHNGLGVTRQHLPYAGEALLFAISDALGHGFTEEVRQAWEVLFQLIVDVMSLKLLDGRKTTGTEMMKSKQRELVRSTWELMASAPDKHGAVMFAKLVSDNPKAGKLFSFGKKKYPYNKLLNENEVISHGERFMSTMGQVVGGLEDPEFLVPMLHQLATRHSGYGVTKDLFVAAKSALMFTLKQGLGKSVFSSEVQDAWTAAYQYIEDTMFEKL